ncbi:S24 family peptidase [Asaia bogorensis]|uniref:LexA family transcriptional regulator n=1 Tax=Asaia bogorensis TaxID=91915 RepID=UPI000EFADEE4|nr:S24 family peptidase [Asaia bogorensis]
MTGSAPIPNFSDLKENWEVSDVADRLKEAVRASGGNKAVSLKSGVPLSTLNGYLAARREMGALPAAKLARTCGISLDWLLFGEGETCAPTPVAEPARADVAMIRYYPDIQASAGYGMLGCDQPRCEEIALPSGILEDLRLPAKDAIMICVSGDSMSPTLMPHDRIIVDARMSDYLSGIYVFVSDGTVLVKRISLGPDGYADIISDNDRYPSKAVQKDRFHWGKPQTSDAITIIGRVIYKMQRMS